MGFPNIEFGSSTDAETSTTASDQRQEFDQSSDQKNSQSDFDTNEQSDLQYPPEGEVEEEGGCQDVEEKENEDNEGKEDENANDNDMDNLKEEKEGDSVTGLGMSRAEIRKMQEELTWQEGDAEHPNHMDLRVGSIMQVIQHDSDELLYISEVDLGNYDESRLIATTLKEHYKMEELKNRKVVILCNVKPLVDREIRSKTGMLLLATKTKFNENGEEVGEYVELLEPHHQTPLGSRVYVEGFPMDNTFPEKDEEFYDFVLKDFTVNSNQEVVWRGLPLKIENFQGATVKTRTLSDTYCKLD